MYVSFVSSDKMPNVKSKEDEEPRILSFARKFKSSRV
jgi:hypothetical protein